MMNFELIQTVLLLVLTCVIALAYLARVKLKGRARFDRVDRQGGSSLLSKELMEGAYWFFQPLGKILVYCRVTPNQVSWSSLLFGILAGACLAVGHFGSGAAFGTVSAVLDALDGWVARNTGRASDAGEVLDAAVDRYVEFFFLGGLMFYYREIPLLAGLTFAALIGSFMISYSTAKAEALQVEAPKSNMRRPERATYLLLGAALSPVTIPWLETTRDYVVHVVHPMDMALTLVAVMANMSAIERFWVIAKNIRLKEAAEARSRAAAEAARQEEERDEVAAGTSTHHKPIR